MLDVFTLLLLGVCSATLVGVTTSLTRTSNDDGYREASLASWALAVGYLAHMLRGRIPEGASILVGNGMLWLGAGLHACSFRRFNRPEARNARVLAPMGAAFVGFALLWALGGAYDARTLYVSAVLAAVTLYNAFTLLRVRDGLLGRHVAAGLSVMMGAALVGRIALLVIAPDHPADHFSPSFERSLTYVPAVISTMGIGLSIVVMHHERTSIRLRELAMTDSLTGCANRRAVLEDLAAAVADADAHHTDLTLIAIDVDGFKRFNDLYGHAVGDRVLVHVAERLQRGLDRPCGVARSGGEEFCVVLRRTDARRAAQIAEAMRAALDETELRLDSLRLHATASFGVAAHPRASGETVDDLLRRADAALYAAKAAGKNAVALAT